MDAADDTTANPITSPQDFAEEGETNGEVYNGNIWGDDLRDFELKGFGSDDELEDFSQMKNQFEIDNQV